MRQILAAVVDRPGASPVIRPLTIDAPRAGEVLVRVRACGVCHTDMVLRDGHLPLGFPAVLGHEGAGVVEAVGAGVTEVAPGDHVLMSFRSCRPCRQCAAHAPAYCANFVPLNFDGRRPDGSHGLHDGPTGVSGAVFGQSAFATHALAHADNIVPVDRALPFELIAPLGCGVQTGAGTVLETLRVAPGERIAVLGAGGVGLSAIMAARVAGAAEIAALDRHPARLALARQLGATTATPTVGGLPETLDHIVDTTGVASLVAAAATKLGPRGTLALAAAYPPGGLTLEPAFLMSGGRRVVGVVEGGVDPKRFIPRLVALMAAGLLPIERFIRTYPFVDVARAIADSESGAVVKPVLVMPDTA